MRRGGRRPVRLHQSGGRAGAGAGRQLRAGRRRARGVQCPCRIRCRQLVAFGTGQAQGGADPLCRSAGSPPRGAGAAGDPRHGQADRRLAGGGHPRRRAGASLERRGDRQDLRRSGGHAPRPARPGHPRAGRRGGGHRAVEFPADDGLLEARPGTGHRQFGGTQAVREVTADRHPHCPAGDRCRHSGRRAQRPAGLRPHRRQGAGAAHGRRHAGLHRLHAGSQAADDLRR